LGSALDTLLQSTQPGLAAAFTLWGSPVTWLEIAAFVIALVMVGLNMRVHPAAWPLAIVSSLMYALLFANSRLYGEASLQIFFAVVALWGWWQWLRGHSGDGRPLRVHRLSRTQALVAAVLTLAAWPIAGAALDRFTDSDVPFLDALPTVASVAGQVLLGRKLIENWPTWLAVNLVSTVLFGIKGLWLTVLLYGLFALLSVAGWRAWLALEGRERAS
jgi:nicotinamide mononucleotide transporter